MRVNLYLVYSPLHYLCAKAVAKAFEAGERNFLVLVQAGKLDGIVEPSSWDGVIEAPWPRFHPLPGPFGRVRRTLRNLEAAARLCEGAEAIRIHAPVIDTEAVNYHINFLRTRFPRVPVTVRLIPDGMLNLRRHPLGSLKEAAQYLKKLRRLASPSLDYHTFRGDRTGSDAPVVERIYTLPRMPHPYDPGKAVELPDFLPTLGNGCGGGAGRALVVGQPLVAYRSVTPEALAALTAGIREFLAVSGAREIFYKGHPRDREKSLFHPDYRELMLREPLEIHLSKVGYDVIAGFTSTALATARLVVPPSCRVVSYGVNLAGGRKAEHRDSLLDAMREMGIEVVSHPF